MAMKRSRLWWVLTTLMFGFAVVLHSAGSLEGSDRLRTNPITHKGKKWRIGYYEGGPFINYPANLSAIADGLAELGWMDKPMPAEPADPTDARPLWIALGTTGSDYLQFVPDAFYSADWDDTLRASNRAAAIRRLQDKELDFMIAMGTWAGQDLANNLHSVPVMVVSCSDPVKSGIVQSAARSGLPNVHARCDPDRYTRQVRLFHDIVGFKRLGVVYENTVAGRSYAALADIEKVAAERGFVLVKCEAPWSGTTRSASIQSVIDCHKTLAPRIDALFLTVHKGVDASRMDEILAPLIEYKIPTWSQRGPEEVRHGALLSIARGEFQAVGRYHARIMAEILNGATAGALPQIFEDPKKIAINLKTAQAIGFKVPRGLLQVADEIYQ
jgi:ABC-type uncharacterized transport system substrate-binding protein